MKRPNSLAPALIFAAIFAVTARAAEPSLKDAYKNDFLIGSALGSPRSYSETELRLIATQFNAATPEVCMKPRPIHPKEGVWNFKEADAFLAFCDQNQIAAFGHTLVWHEDCPDWFFKDDEHAASRELVLRRMQNHIHTILTRYKGRIHGWDVVNEAISDSPKEYLRKTKWLQTIGDDYVEQAFRFAHEADPDMPLQYNDYNIEREPKRSRAVRLIRDLQSKGIPVVAVGIQAHWSVDHVPFNDLEEAIRQFQALGIKVMISELDMDTLPRSAAYEPKPASADLLAHQAEQYAHLFRIFHAHRDVITRVSFWGIDDAHTWLNGWPKRRYNHPLLFDRDAKPKPAFETVMGVIETKG